jgi:uncharacterized protein YcfL
VWGVKHILLLIAVVALVGCASPTWTSDSSNPQNGIVEKWIRLTLKKPTGELTKADLEKVTALSFYNNQLTDVKGLEEQRTFKKIK